MKTSSHSWLRLPKPKTFLGLMSLQTGAELITLALLIGKATGLYGLLALLTGAAPGAVQLSMHLYSAAVLAALALLLPHVRRRAPLPGLLLAWVYAADTALAAAYTAHFAAAWYVARADADAEGPEGRAPPPAAAAAAAAAAADTAASMALVVVLTLARPYLLLVVMSWARAVLRAHAAGGARGDKGRAAGPFAAGTPGGEGWKGRLGRALVFVGRGYWLGSVEDDEEEEEAVGYAAGGLLAAAADEEDQ